MLTGLCVPTLMFLNHWKGFFWGFFWGEGVGDTSLPMIAKDKKWYKLV